MIRIKTISQFFHTYEVPEALYPDFTNWLMRQDGRCGDYEVDQQFVNELVAYADRIEARSTGSNSPNVVSNGSNEATSTK